MSGCDKGLLSQIKSWPAWTKVVVIAVAVLVVADGASVALAPRMGLGRTARSVARPAVTPTPQAFEVPVSSQSASPEPLASTFPCKLPLSNGQLRSAGFLTFPEAGFTADPNSAGKCRPVVRAELDLAVAKWVPVHRVWVSPDDSRYAYWDWQTRTGTGRRTQ